MPKYLEIRFVDAGVSARALLLQDMPRTSSELLKHLPVEGTAIHARYSGSEVAMLLPKEIRIGREKATCAVLGPGGLSHRLR